MCWKCCNHRCRRCRCNCDSPCGHPYSSHSHNSCPDPWSCRIAWHRCRPRNGPHASHRRWRHGHWNSSAAADRADRSAQTIRHTGRDSACRWHRIRNTQWQRRQAANSSRGRASRARAALSAATLTTLTCCRFYFFFFYFASLCFPLHNCTMTRLHAHRPMAYGEKERVRAGSGRRGRLTKLLVLAASASRTNAKLVLSRPFQLRFQSFQARAAALAESPTVRERERRGEHVSVCLAVSVCLSVSVCVSSLSN